MLYIVPIVSYKYNWKKKFSFKFVLNPNGSRRFVKFSEFTSKFGIID